MIYRLRGKTLRWSCQLLLIIAVSCFVHYWLLTFGPPLSYYSFQAALPWFLSGILLADTCGFGKISIDLRIALAETYLAASEPRKALQNARNALDRSEAPECQYAWGKADGLHFCGVAHLRLGERELARERLCAALKLREGLAHGRIEETRAALRDLG